jgi:serine/threonine-protein kinase RsbW/stage II sporulation protein AB (anti-sigma F factor)
MSTATWTVPAEREQVAPLRHRVVAHAAEHNVAEPPINDLALAVSEAITNAVVHAFRRREPGHVTVCLDIEPEINRVEVVVADDGDGMVPRPDTPGLGLGLPLIAQVAETFQIGTPPTGQGTEIRMTFHLPVYGK